jgi:nucleoid-associated protein YgaU
MEFWLAYNNFAEKLQLPVNPMEFNIRSGNKNNVVDILDMGELNLIGGQKLAEIQLQSFFPANWAPYCAYRSIPEPYDAVNKIESWRVSKRPIRLIISDTPVNMACAIEEFEYGERGGTRDISYTLTLKEYRFIQIKQVGQAGAAAIKTGSTAVRPDDKPEVKKYTVQPNDTLFDIAKKVYDNSGRWREIYNANLSVIGKDPDTLYIGQELVIP